MKIYPRSISVIVSIFFLVILWKTELQGQLLIDTAITKEQLVEMLVDNSVYYESVKLSCDGEAKGLFHHALDSTNLTLESGIILTTGNAISAIGPNNNHSKTGENDIDDVDKDLAKLANDNTVVRDKCVLEFDIVPIGDEISFNYVFASEEYPEYICSEYNDVFGFFVSGPGIDGPYENNAVNIAILDAKAKHAVAINSVNSGVVGNEGEMPNCQGSKGSLKYSKFFIDNSELDFDDPNKIQYDGFTTKLEARIKVKSCKKYHFKLAIADIGDSELDSGVFIEKNSFKSNTRLADIQVTLPTCQENSCDGSASLTLLDGIADNYTISWMVEGESVNMGNLVLNDICKNLKARAIIETKNRGCMQVIDVKMPKDLSVTANGVSGSAMDSCTGAIAVKASGGTTPYRYSWNNGGKKDALTGLCPGKYSVTVWDNNNCQTVATYEVPEIPKIASVDEAGRTFKVAKIIKATDQSLTSLLKKRNLLSFQKNESKVLTTDNAFLDDLATLIKEDSQTILLIIGHASSEGPAELNLQISKNRAEQVRNYLLSKGVDEQQLEVIAKGESELLVEEESEADRIKNRRVEIQRKN
ncbi:choice-of-anchor L domain-containing protein [Flavilitoribacter nigricans]|uniref:OmpA-like domain-containing protein n=1 Tax=Flavilitoribacter nigricans (strain ATCC 23147 / DSM 23189 / NBRC 102662 / NCIMB 1420 / SS-2) TaxID=1122177 RepID=A0A2D0MWF5_FLAN2|nr:choice-of-anchor L domain-containing protein [Flavilitoribacter nigricans]PHN00594.1 hypothetical protein CRP01_41430 [Flavilitoribacter nigricans DSM 23189 = NBRC 102662]